MTFEDRCTVSNPFRMTYAFTFRGTATPDQQAANSQSPAVFELFLFPHYYGNNLQSLSASC